MASATLTSSDVDTDDTPTWSAAAASYGSAAIDSATGQWTYTLDNSHAAVQGLGEGDTLTDSFLVTVTDEDGLSDTRTVTITITGDGDAPVIGAGNDTGAVAEDGTLLASATLTSSDVDTDDTPTWSAAAASYGSAAIDSATGQWTYTLDNSHAAVQGLGEGDTLTDSFLVTVTDEDGLSDTRTVTITITGDGDAPVIGAGNDTGAVAEDGTLLASATLTSSDVDTDDTPTWSAAAASYGAAAIDSATGQWTYTLDNSHAAVQGLGEGDTLTDSFLVTVTDEDGLSDTRTVTITITGDNDAPVANDVTTNANEDGPAVIVAANYSDVDVSDTHTFSINTTGTVGSVTNHHNGTFSYNPNGQFEHLGVGETATDTFTYTVHDGHGGMDTATVTVTIHGQNDAPVANANSYSTGQGTPLIVGSTGVLGNDTDVDGDSLTAVYVGGPSHGTLTLNPNGSFTYTPHAFFVGVDSFTYKAYDGHVHSNVATVTVTVAPGAARKITGGGSVGSGVRNFGLNAQPTNDGGVKGNLEFQDKQAGYNVKSSSITLVAVASDGKTGIIRGTATLNGVSGYSFEVRVKDQAEPGAGVDKYGIRVWKGAFEYKSPAFDTGGAVLDKGGNIQVHKEGSKLQAAGSESVSDAAASGVLINSAGQLLVGIHTVSVNDLTGRMDAEHNARILDAISVLNETFAEFGIHLTTADPSSDEPADLPIFFAVTTELGGVAEGVLGITSEFGEITIVEGWNWYVRSDAASVGQDQFDFQTVVTHELGHALGLGHSSSTDSVMYPALATGMSRRGLAADDIMMEESHEGAEALLAEPFYQKDVHGHDHALEAHDDHREVQTVRETVTSNLFASERDGIERDTGHAVAWPGRQVGGNATRITVGWQANVSRVPTLASRPRPSLVGVNSPAVAANLQSAMAADIYGLADRYGLPESLLTSLAAMRCRAAIATQVDQPDGSLNAESSGSTLPDDTLVKEADVEDIRVATLSSEACDTVFGEEVPIWTWGAGAALTIGTVANLIGRESSGNTQSGRKLPPK